MMESDKALSTDTESNIGSDEDETIRKKPRSSIDEDDDSNETNFKNIWRKRRKLSTIVQTEITNLEQNSPAKTLHHPHQHIKEEYLRSNSNEYEKSPHHKYLQRKPHDHQVPNFASTFPGDLTMANR